MKSMRIIKMIDVVRKLSHRKAPAGVWFRCSVVSTLVFFSVFTQGIGQSLNTNISYLKPTVNKTSFVKRVEWPQKVDAGGCWVDYASVFYWYSDKPGSYRHEPVSTVEERSKVLLHSSKAK